MITKCIFIIAMLYNPAFCENECKIQFCLNDPVFNKLFTVECVDSQMALINNKTGFMFGLTDKKCQKS